MFNGALTALVTPMRDGDVDLAGLRKLVEFQIERGIDGLVPCGTTGEAATMTANERFDVIRATVEQANGRVPVVAGAGANNTQTAIAGGKMAAEAGADAQLQVTPYYNKPPQRALVAHFTAVADATDLPMVLYNVPGRTSCDMLPDTVAELAEHPRIVGIKEATGSIQRAQQVIRASATGNFCVLSGDDFTCTAMTAMGGNGVISVVSNLAPGETARMIAAAREAQMAEACALHYRLETLMDLLFIEANPIPVKAGTALLGFTANEVRLPLLPLEPEKVELLAAEMARVGLTS